MQDPVGQARRCVRLLLASSGIPEETLNRRAIRFRPDGKGGELAFPAPAADIAPVLRRLPEHPWLETAAASSGWIAFDLSEQWRELVRRWEYDGPGLSFQPPPIPGFPARIDPAHWRLCALLRTPDPAIAARLDPGNPAVRVRRAQRLALLDRGGGQRDRRLVNEAALLFHYLARGDARWTAAQLVRLTDAYLARPGEDALTARTIRSVSQSLGLCTGAGNRA